MADLRRVFTHTPAIWLTATSTITASDYTREHMLSIQQGKSEFLTSYLEKLQQNGILSQTSNMLEMRAMSHKHSGMRDLF